MDTKIWYKSKRFYTNFSVIVLAVGSLITGEKTLEGVMPELVVTIYGLVNLILASVSDKPLGFKD